MFLKKKKNKRDEEISIYNFLNKTISKGLFQLISVIEKKYKVLYQFVLSVVCFRFIFFEKR